VSSLLVTGIAELTTNDPAVGDGTASGRLVDAALVVERGRVLWVGPRSLAPDADLRLDLTGRAVLPGFVDAHSHLVFAGDRSAEFTARMTGVRYDGGGIVTTVAATRVASDELLLARGRALVAEMRSQGTTTVEIKSGYGLTVHDEARLLAVARELTDETTYLGAHVVPAGADRAAYLDLVTGAMLAACAPLARWVDVFCEPASPHAFDGDEARAVLEAGIGAGLLPRLHAGQLAPGPGVRLGVELGAASVDHCTHLAGADVDALVGARPSPAREGTVATLLPGVEFSTRSPYPPARRLLDAGAVVALATDCNPGTSFTSSMPFVVALAVREMAMTPDEALWSATARTSGTSASGRGQTSRWSTRRPRCTWPTAPASPSPARSTWAPPVPSVGEPDP
jgi:imidazolonepropionase